MLGTKRGTKPVLKTGVSNAKTGKQLASATEKWGLAGACFSPGRAQASLGKKLFSTPVWRVTKSEAAVLAYPEVQKFEAQIEQARSGGGCYAVDVEAQGPPNHLAFPSIRGTSTVATATTFMALIEEWARKKRIDNPQTKQKVETHFKSLADFLD